MASPSWRGHRDILDDRRLGILDLRCPRSDRQQTFAISLVRNPYVRTATACRLQLLDGKAAEISSPRMPFRRSFGRQRFELWRRFAYAGVFRLGSDVQVYGRSSRKSSPFREQPCPFPCRRRIPHHRERNREAQNPSGRLKATGSLDNSMRPAALPERAGHETSSVNHRRILGLGGQFRQPPPTMITTELSGIRWNGSVVRLGLPLPETG